MFLFILFMKGLCSPRVFTLFNTLFIFVIYFLTNINSVPPTKFLNIFVIIVLFHVVICCRLLYYFYYYHYLKSHFLFYFKVTAVLQNRLRKKFGFPWLNRTGALWFSHVLYFLFGVWQLDIAMRLSSAFCLKSGRDLHSN